MALGRLATFKESSGMHTLVHFDSGLEQQFMLDCAKKSRIDLRSTQSYYFDAPPTNEFLIPFSTTDSDTISAVVKHFSILVAT